jgi:rubrerythrin
MKDDPFRTWTEEAKATHAARAASLLKQFAQREHAAARNLKEAQSYYSSEQWKADGVASESVDRLINDLQATFDAAKRVRTETQDQLDDILQSQRSHRALAPLTQRREDLVRAAPAPETDGSIEPTPLETFLLSAKPAKTKKRTRKRKLAM